MNLNNERKTSKYGILLSTSWGILLAFISGFIISWSTVLVKYLRNIDTGQLAVYRHLAVLSFCLPHLVYSRQEILGPRGYRISVVILATLSATTIFLYFIAFRYLPLGEAAAIISCYPPLVTVTGRYFLKESFGLLHIISLLTTTVGIILVTGFYQTVIENSRAYTTENIYGLAAALASLISGTAMFTLTRKLRNIHSSVLIFSNGILGIIQCGILTALSGSFSLNYRGTQQGLIIVLGLLSYFGVVCVIVALQYAEVGPVTTMRAASEIFLSFVWQAVIFGDVPDGVSIFGAVLVCVSITFVAFSQRINAFLPRRWHTLC